MVSIPLWMMVAATVAWCIAATRNSFTMALQHGAAAAHRKPVAALVISLFLALPFVLLSALSPWASVRAALILTLGWVTPCKLLLLLFSNFLLDCPAWTLSHFSHFLLASLLPVHIQSVQVKAAHHSPQPRRLHGLFFNLCALICTLSLYDSMVPPITHAAHFLLLYIVLDSPHWIASMVLLLLFGVQTHPMFCKPWISTSLTDFWGKRCDLMANALLRHSVYNPIVNLLWWSGSKNCAETRIGAAAAMYGQKRTHAADDQGHLHATSSLVATPSMSTLLPLSVRLIAVNATFMVSGLIHELLFFCLTQGAAAPTWLVTACFMVHGLATSAEISLRRSCPKHAIFRMPRALKLVLTMCFVYVTTTWLFFPPLVRAGIFTQCASEFRALKEI